MRRPIWSLILVGFWPTPLMLERILDRVAENMGRIYDMDEEQLEQTRQVLRETFPKWLKENRAEIMELTNQFFEAQLHDEPPDPEMVTGWAQAAPAGRVPRADGQHV
jgi:hypothetical protein